MTTVFVLQNQHQQFLSKQQTWVDGRDAALLFRTEHKDEAINQVFEVSSKDYTLRVTPLRCSLNERGVPQLAVAAAAAAGTAHTDTAPPVDP